MLNLFVGLVKNDSPVAQNPPRPTHLQRTNGRRQLVWSRPLSPACAVRSLATRAILQIPRILDTIRAGPARGQHTLLVRTESAVRTVIAAAPNTIAWSA